MKDKKLIITFFIFLATIILCALVKPVFASTGGIGEVNVTAERTVNMPIKTAQAQSSSGVMLTAQGRIQTYKVKHQMFHGDSSRIMNIWKLVSADAVKGGNSTLKDLYCVRAGLGFASRNGGSNYNPDAQNYDTGYELPEEYDDVSRFCSDSDVKIFEESQKENYNKMMWIFDHMLLEDASDEEARAYLVKHAGYTDAKFSEANLRENVLTRADIEAIQQLAIWYYTNADESVYHGDVYANNQLQTLYLCMDDGALIYKTDGDYKSLKDIYDDATSLLPSYGGHSCGSERQEAANLLFKYLIEGYNKDTEQKKGRIDSQGLYIPMREITVYVVGNQKTQQPIVQVKERKETVEVKVDKEWDDSENQDSLRGNYTVKLVGKANNKVVKEEEKELTSEKTTHTWTNLPKYDDEGYVITYTVTESKVPAGYTPTVTGDATSRI